MAEYLLAYALEDIDASGWGWAEVALPGGSVVAGQEVRWEWPDPDPELESELLEAEHAAIEVQKEQVRRIVEEDPRLVLEGDVTLTELADARERRDAALTTRRSEFAAVNFGGRVARLADLRVCASCGAAVADQVAHAADHLRRG